jgi:hypothetical protein
MTGKRLAQFRSIHRLLVALLVVCLVVPSPLVAQKDKQTSQAEQGPVTFEMKTDSIKRGKKLSVIVTVGPDTIVAESKDGATLSIPVASVLDMWYSVEPNWAKDMLEGPGNPGLGVLVLLAFQADRHEVTILWREDGIYKIADFKVGKDKDKFTSFLAALERVTGHPGLDLDEMFGRYVQDMWKRNKKKVSLQFDRPVWVDGVELKPGLYQLVLLECSEKQGILYFFPGKKTKEYVVTAPVEITAQPGSVSAARVTYKRESGPATIAEIWMPDKVVHPTGPQLFDPWQAVLHEGTPAIGLGDGFTVVAFISYRSFNGEAAVRFPVQHVHPHERQVACRGFLYVTARRIAYDPIANPRYGDHAFNVLRTEISKAQLTDFVLPEETYHFEPFFEHASKQGRKEWRERISPPFYALFSLAIDHFDALEEELQQPFPYMGNPLFQRLFCR